MTGGLEQEGEVALALSEGEGEDLSTGQAQAGALTPLARRTGMAPSPPSGERAGVRGFQSHIPPRLLQFIKFCCVGGSGVVVDMAVLALLADPRFLGWNVLLSKICAAEVAMTNNFIWNELWTFRASPSLKSEMQNPESRRYGLLRRFLTFNAICGIGIGLAVALLHLFHTWLGGNIYLSNCLAILLVTCWNFSLNSMLNWRDCGVTLESNIRNASLPDFGKSQ